MTGTPEGVNAVVTGDVMRGHIDGLSDIIVRVIEGQHDGGAHG
jgi:fumarylpyruvate hydrolase